VETHDGKAWCFNNHTPILNLKLTHSNISKNFSVN
jgi:hypothetical protein